MYMWLRDGQKEVTVCASVMADVSPATHRQHGREGEEGGLEAGGGRSPDEDKTEEKSD